MKEESDLNERQIINRIREIQSKTEDLMDEIRSDYPTISMSLSTSQHYMCKTIEELREIEKPEECVSPFDCNDQPEYPSNRPKYCFECYRMKAS